MTAAALPLEGYRVLDLCEGPRAYCGRLLCDLGAEVVKLEAPGGEPGRGQVTARMPLAFHFLNAGKRSAVLDAEGDAWPAPLDSWLDGCDVVLEDIEPGSAREPFRQALRQRLAPDRVVWASLTAWGRDGPLAGAPASDAVLLAHSGLLSLAGHPRRPPLPAYGDQAWLSLSAFAAMATLGALYRRALGGGGAQIDASAVEAMAHSLENAPQFVDLEGIVRRRTGNRTEAATGVFPCADGHVYLFTAMGGTIFAWDALVRWLEDAGTPGAAVLRDACWADAVWRRTAEAHRSFEAVFTGFTAGRARQALFEEGQRRGVIIGAVNTPSSLLSDPALRSRGFFRPVALPGWGELDFPGSPYRFAGVDVRARGPAPALGEFTTAATQVN